MFHTLHQYIASTSQARGLTPDTLDYQQECLWRLEKWDEPIFMDSECTFNTCVLGTLQGLARQEADRAAFFVGQGKDILTAMLRTANFEACADVYPLLTRLKQLAELAKFGRNLNGGDGLRLVELVESLQQRDALLHADFLPIEPVLSQRLCLTAILSEPGKAVTGASDLFLESSLNLCRQARQAGLFWICNREVDRPEFAGSLEYTFEKAQLLWAQGERAAGVSIAKDLLADINGLNPMSPSIARLQPKVMTSLGQWLNQLKSEPMSVIFSEYLEKALQLLKEGGGQSHLAACEAAHLAMATLADQQYKHNLDYMTSTEFDERKSNIEMREKQVQILKEGLTKGDTALRNAAIIQERFLNMDRTEIGRVVAQKEEFLLAAVEHYLEVLQCGKLSLPFYRILSLWFENEDSAKLNQLLAQMLPSIPSHKIVALLYQMAARMSLPGKEKTSFASILFGCIKRICIDHPHHALPIVLALKNAGQDEVIEGRNPPKDAAMDAKSNAASLLVKELEGQRELTKIVQKYKLMCVAMIQVAYLKPPQKNPMSAAVLISSSATFVKIRDWSDIPPPTDTLPVRPDRNYASYVGIVRFEPTYRLVGGVNAPKKTVCLGSDGLARDQLIKGQDDLRQDAVMQQVFRLMNQLLTEDKETRQQALQVRTYKIIPLSQRSGVLEWCRHTRPIADILVGVNRQSGVHAKYFPHQLSWAECRTSYMEHMGRETAQDNFAHILSNFSPAMKFFFLETFPSPGEYYTSRSAYTKSVATTSMVGYILGLGDRHINNILVDIMSGHLVHIDFGVAFDQGKILPTPETVPFRLTQDLVDGFGPLGVEGVFRTSCERSLSVLRANKEALLTVLEVMLHDPLYNWSVGPGKAAAKQAGEWKKLCAEESAAGQKNKGNRQVFFFC